ITITSSMREKPVARLIIPFPGIVGAIGFIVMLPPSCPALFHADRKKSCQYFMRIEKNHVNEILEAPNQGRATTRPSVKL
ncbi:hypothetical protein VCX83_19290, partial [Aeromonas caviae]|uniref:hypothetical protein n=1 Tax=Aeromonas caviae TaxID=648 RepID=UPI002B249D7D